MIFEVELYLLLRFYIFHNKL